MTTTRAYVLVAGYLLVIYAAVAMLHCADAPTPPPMTADPDAHAIPRTADPDAAVEFNHTTPDFIRSSATMTGATDGEEDSHLIEIAAAADVTPALLAPFHSAAEWWTNVIRETNFKPARISAHQSAQCLPDVDAMDMEIPGLRILVQVHPIDGEGNTLGYSRPCFLHPHGAAVTVLGSMEFDSADIELMIRRGIAHDVVRHEMGHVLGIGTLWQRAGFLAGLPEIPPDYRIDLTRTVFPGNGGGDTLNITPHSTSISAATVTVSFMDEGPRTVRCRPVELLFDGFLDPFNRVSISPFQDCDEDIQWTSVTIKDAGDNECKGCGTFKRGDIPHG